MGKAPTGNTKWIKRLEVDEFSSALAPGPKWTLIILLLIVAAILYKVFG